MSNFIASNIELFTLYFLASFQYLALCAYNCHHDTYKHDIREEDQQHLCYCCGCRRRAHHSPLTEYIDFNHFQESLCFPPKQKQKIFAFFYEVKASILRWSVWHCEMRFDFKRFFYFWQRFQEIFMRWFCDFFWWYFNPFFFFFFVFWFCDF